MKDFQFGLKSNDVISRMFFSAAIAMIFSQVAGVVANIIDGVVTSRFFGPDSLSAISLVSPFVATIVLIAGFISTGSQVICSSLVGEGKREEANALFSLSIIMCLVGASVCVLLCIISPDLIFRTCGVTIDSHPQFYTGMGEYLKGYMYGIPAVMLIQILGPFIVMDNGKVFFTASAFLLCISDIIGDLANAIFFHGGLFGMGMATTISFYIQLVFLLSYYFRKNCYFRFTFLGFHLKHLVDICRSGSPTLIRKLATVLRDLFISRINLSVALAGSAVAARAIQNDINTFMFCIGLGIGKALLTMTGVYYSANDKKGLKRLFSYSVMLSITLSCAVGGILFVLAKAIAMFYTSDVEVIDFASFAIRCLAINLVLDTLLVAFQNYLQGIRQRLLVNAFNFGERFFVPVFVAFIMGSFFGSKGVLASLAVGKAILMLMIFVIVCVHKKGLPRSLEDFMFLPKDFGGKETDNIYATMRTMEDVMLESKKAEEFCLAHNIDPKEAKHMAYFVEEMAGNVIAHGKPKGNGTAMVEYRLFANGERICMTLRDYCNQFNPTDFYEAHNNDEIGKHSGIKLVMGMAKEISYFNAFNSNNLIIYL